MNDSTQTHSAGKQEMIAAGHLADDDEGRKGRFGRGGEEAGHAHDHETGRVRHEPRPKVVQQVPTPRRRSRR